MLQPAADRHEEAPRRRAEDEVERHVVLLLQEGRYLAELALLLDEGDELGVVAEAK